MRIWFLLSWNWWYKKRKFKYYYHRIYFHLFRQKPKNRNKSPFHTQHFLSNWTESSHATNVIAISDRHSRIQTGAWKKPEEESIERHIWQVDVTQRSRGRKLLCKVGSPELPDSLSEKFPYFISSFSLFLCIFTALEIHRFFLASTASDLSNSGLRSWW